MAVGKLRAVLNYVATPTALLARKVVRKNISLRKEIFNLKKKKKVKKKKLSKKKKLKINLKKKKRL